MNDFTVTEIVNATTIRLSPAYLFPKRDGEIVNDLVKIAGLNVSNDDKLVIDRLQLILLGKAVTAFDPVPTAIPEVPVQSRIYLGKSELLYFFPEYDPA